MYKTDARLLFIIVLLIFFSSLFVFYQKDYSYSTILPPLINHLYPANFSCQHENIVLLSCSSYSYTSVYCYYLPYVALAWRRLGFEPIIYLVGSDKIFEKMPLMNLLKNDLKIKYYFFNVDQSRSISISQLIRLFGGFLTFQSDTTKDLFIIIADADLVPISRHRFEIDTNQTNSILAVNAYCCPSEKFSYGNFGDIRYYPMSYIGMHKSLWRKIFLPLYNCDLSFNVTVDMMECCLKEKMNETIPKNVIKGSKYWDIDQRLISILIAQAERSFNTYVDKRKLGYRLDPDKNFLPAEFNSILLYDDIHLPNKNQNITFSDHTWTVLSKAFSRLFHNNTIRLLSRYHYQTAAVVLGYNDTTGQTSQ